MKKIMKKLILSIVLVLSSISVFSQAPTQSNLYLAAKSYAIEHGYTICEDKYATLAQGETMYSYKTFYSGLTYIVFAMSDDGDVKDIDVYLYNSDGTEYTKDVTSDQTAAVDVTTYSNRYLKIVVKNYKSDTPEYKSVCRYFVAYK